MTVVEIGQQRQAAAGDAVGVDIAALLDRASVCAAELWPGPSSIARRLQALGERLGEQRLQLAVLGQFKRGKSTVLNALLGAPLLPTGIVPLTAIPTFVAWGPEPLVRVTHRGVRPIEEFAPAAPDDIRACLYRFVAEEANPKNRLEVARVDLFYPAPILEQGVVLIDTPGIGSTHRHNTDAALQVLPECDAALFVVSADPPITEAELAYLETVRPKVARLFFVLNKADYLGARDLGIAVEFLRLTVSQPPVRPDDFTVFAVSALRGLEAKESGDSAALDKSGLPKIEDFLLRFLAKEKMAALRTAVAQKASELLAEMAADLSLRLQSLEMPIEELGKRHALLKQALARIDGEARVIRDLIAGDRRRTVESIEQNAERLRQQGRRRLLAALETALAQQSVERMEAAAREAIAAAVPEFFERELDAASGALGRTVEAALGDHQRRVDALVNLVRRTAADIFAIPYAANAESERMTLDRQPYWVTERLGDTLTGVSADVISRLMPRAMRRARLRRQLEQQVSDLVIRNVENLRWATLQAIDATFRRFADAMDERLTAALAATRGAVEAALAKRSATAAQLETETARLKRLSQALAELRGDLEDMTAKAM